MADDAEWNDLVGRQVLVQKAGRTIRAGCVEAVTIVGDALWLGSHGVETRVLYEKAEGYTVQPTYE